MANNCFLSFFSNNITENTHVRITALAEYRYDEERCSVSFEEQDEEFKNCVTTITVENNSRVTIERSGRYATFITGEKNRRLISQHVTPFGIYSLGITLKSFSSTLDENGGELSFSYVTDSAGGVVSEIEFRLKIKKKQDKTTNDNHFQGL